MKISNTILRAAIDRHNERASRKHAQEVEVQVKRTIATRGGDALLRKVQKLHQQALALEKEATTANLTIAYGSRDAGVDLDYHDRRQVEQAVPTLGQVTLEQVLLMGAASGASDSAQLLDDLKLDWRPTSAAT